MYIYIYIYARNVSAIKRQQSGAMIMIACMLRVFSISNIESLYILDPLFLWVLWVACPSECAQETRTSRVPSNKMIFLWAKIKYIYMKGSFTLWGPMKAACSCIYLICFRPSLFAHIFFKLAHILYSYKANKCTSPFSGHAVCYILSV